MTTQAHVPHSYSLFSSPVGHVLTLAEVKANLRITWDSEDELLHSYIELAEGIVLQDLPEYMLRPAAMELTLDCFPDEIQLARTPVTEIRQVKYYDTEGELQSLTENEDFHADLRSFPARLWPATSWPRTQLRPAAVTVLFSVGYSSLGDVPAAVRNLLHLWVSHLYSNRAPAEQGRPSKVPYTLDHCTDIARLRRIH